MFYKEADVIILGAGTAGAAAAIAAADAGAKVLVAEQFGAAGGSGSLGLVEPLMSTGIEGRPNCSYVSGEIAKRMSEIGAGTADGKSFFDPIMLSFVLEEMLAERGVRMLYHTVVTGVSMESGRVAGVKVFNKSGEGLLRGKCYIDATGDADVCALAGLPVLHGDAETGKNQPCSLRYMLGGVDVDKFWEFLCEVRAPGKPHAPRPAQFDDGFTLTPGRTYAMAKVFEQGMAEGFITRDDASYWQFFTVPGRPDAVAFNCPEFFDIPNVTDGDAQARVQSEGKLSILRHLRFYRARFPGFENARILSVAAMVGVRESRRAVTEYILSDEDACAWRKFGDAIAQSNYPVDIHGRKLHVEELNRDRAATAPYYEVPFRALMVKDVDNLLVAGRNLGAGFAAQASARIIPTCRAMGEAAGIAAAMNLRDGAKIREIMIGKGAQFAPKE